MPARTLVRNGEGLAAHGIDRYNVYVQSLDVSGNSHEIDPMARHEIMSLFEEPPEKPEAARADAPLAERMRPRSLDEFVGQAEVVGESSLLGTALRRGGKLPSLVLWGPPGTGKTTLARLFAERTGAKFVALSAVFSGVREVRS